MVHSLVTKFDKTLPQSWAGITNCGKKSSKSVIGITTCDKQLLQNERTLRKQIGYPSKFGTILSLIVEILPLKSLTLDSSMFVIFLGLSKSYLVAFPNY